jgi:IS30 family transposase
MNTNETPATETAPKQKRRYTKTTPELRENIAQMLKDNVHPSKIATDLQVSPPLIYEIKKGMGLTRPYNRKAPAEPVAPIE